jgi:hypothetical protein
MLGFHRTREVFDPEDERQETLVAAPEGVGGWVEWFREHPDLDTEEPKPVTVGDVSGTQIDAVAEQFTILWGGMGQNSMFYSMGAPSRIIVLDVEGETVLIISRASSEDGFEKLLPKAQVVLDSVEWEVYLSS